MAANSRRERPVRRGRIDDTGGEGERGEKLYYHLTLLAETTPGYRNLMKLSSAAYLEGYYYKPRVDWELLERYHDGPHRHDGLPRRRGAPGAARRGRRRGDARWPAACRTSSGARTSSSSCRTTASPSSAGRTRSSIEIARRIGAPLARHERQPLLPARGRRGARRPAVRADRCRRSTTPSGSSSRARSTT